MKLSELDPSFLAFTQKPGVLRCHGDYLKAQGVHFNCPDCIGKTPHHSFTLLFPSAPEHAKPEGRWNSTGTSFQDLTLQEVVKGSCGFKGFVNNGEIVSTIV